MWNLQRNWKRNSSATVSRSDQEERQGGPNRAIRTTSVAASAKAQGGIGVFEEARTKDRFALVLMKNERRFFASTYFLELRRANDSVYPNRYGLFGGRIEEGETARECAVREVFEETGVRIAQSDLVELLSFNGENDNGDVNEGGIFLHSFLPGNGITLAQIRKAQRILIGRLKDPDDLPGEPVEIASWRWPRWKKNDWLRLTPQAAYALLADLDREKRHKNSH
ncbi:MAG: NUDIX domain-containing protein [Alphaproteobacteria bacterium]|nr:NUDIX domain-containing protein [Alphaproteobacteria bacterium]